MSSINDNNEGDIKALQSRIHELEQEVASKQKMVATVSHELRTPMGAIISMAELLCENSSDGAQKKYADTLKMSANSLLTIVNQLLAESKESADNQGIIQKSFCLHALINGIIASLEARLKDQPIKITLNRAANLPEKMTGDEGKLTQVLNNLIDNAIKFTQVGEIALSVDLLEEKPGGCKLKFSLQDTGLGIEPEARQKIFSPYTQADTSISDEYGGTGLGLSICKELVESMGGEINCDSNPGLGSVFTFTVNLQQAPLDQPSATQMQAPERTSTLPHILVVDDNKINQMLIATYLEKGDLNFTLADGGRQALELLKEQHFDMILMDVQMPEMDGLETTAHIRQLQSYVSKIPVVALTANAMQGDREKYLASGMDDYLAKPVKAETLFQMIWKHTQNTQSETRQISG